MIQNHFRDISGRKTRNDGFEKVYEAVKDNVMIVQVDPTSPDKMLRSGGQLASRNPLMGAMTTYIS